MKMFLRASNQSVRLIICFICLVIPSLACQFINQVVPTATQIKISPTSTSPSTEIPIPTNTPIGCPPNTLTEIPNPDVVENYIGQYLDNKNTLTELILESGQLVNEDYFWNNYARNDKSHLLLWEKEHCRTDNGQLIYTEIIDAVITPPLTENQAFAIGCYKGNEFVPYIQALIDINNNNIYSVWQIDISSNKIVEIPFEGLSCSMGPG